MTLIARYHQLAEHRCTAREGAAGLRKLLAPYHGAVPAQRAEQAETEKADR